MKSQNAFSASESSADGEKCQNALWNFAADVNVKHVVIEFGKQFDQLRGSSRVINIWLRLDAAAFGGGDNRAFVSLPLQFITNRQSVTAYSAFGRRIRRELQNAHSSKFKVQGSKSETSYFS
jgi:hypothetical protein